MKKGLITAYDIKRIRTRLSTAKHHPKTDSSKLGHHIIDRNAEFTAEALEWRKTKRELSKRLVQLSAKEAT